MEQRVVGDASPESAGGAPERTVFSSDDLPAGLDDYARFKLWHDLYVAAYCEFDLTLIADQPFRARTEIQQFGAVSVANTVAGVDRLVRSPKQVAAATRSNFCVAFSRNGSSFVQAQLGRETVHDGDAAILVTEGEAGDIRHPGGFNFFLLDIPQQPLLERVGNAFDLVARPLTAAPHVTAHLRRYVEILQKLDIAGQDPALRDHVASTLLDLVALVLDAQGDSATLARARGLRAARLQSILAAIRSGYADPAISSQRVGLKVGLSARYVNELLHETGLSFAERVLELRLQRARAELADPRHDRRKVIDIAYDCGFNDVSYFNRCFRRRFGASPTQFRGAEAASPRAVAPLAEPGGAGP
jgi:AraC-like DNA-binding protein